MKLIKFIHNAVRLGIYEVGFMKLLWNEVDIWILTAPMSNSTMSVHFDLWYAKHVAQIVISSTSTSCRRTVVLHEVGHYIDYKTVGAYKFIAMASKPIDSIEQEATAWEHALRLSRLYNININLPTVVQSLESYGLFDRFEPELLSLETGTPAINIIGGNC